MFFDAAAITPYRSWPMPAVSWTEYPLAPQAAIPLAGWFLVVRPLTVTGESGYRKNRPKTSSASVVGSSSASAFSCAVQHAFGLTAGSCLTVFHFGQLIVVLPAPAPTIVRPLWSTQTASR